MKLVLIAVLILFLFVPLAGASNVYLNRNSAWGQNLTDVYYGSLALGDIDSDGDLDLVLTGQSNSGDVAKIFLNNGTTFNENRIWQQNLMPMRHGCISLGDIDNDGDLDLALAGCTSGGGQSPCSAVTAKVYSNNGSSLIENSTWKGDITPAYDCSIVLGDVDSDGDLDLAMIGQGAGGNIAKIHINNGTEFQENQEWQANLDAVFQGSLGWGDIDNDGDLDLVLTGDKSVEGKVTKIYINNGTTLAESSNWGANLTAVDRSSVILGDYDNDGGLDIALIGQFTTDHLDFFRNKGSTFVFDQDETTIDFAGYFRGSIGWGDYDNDGDLDLAAIGKEFGRNKIYLNNDSIFEIDDSASNDLFKDDFQQSSLTWGDIDNDGDLDLIASGVNITGLFTRVYKNNFTNSNINPIAPSLNLNSTFNFSEGILTLSWGNGSDMETPTLGLYYNLRVGTCSGCHDVVSGVYGGYSGGGGGGGPSAGYFGNMMQRKSITLNRPDLENETIYWAVQTIDTGLAKSAWSEEQVYEIVIASPSCYENWTYGEWSSCVNNQQTRTATDLNGCGTEMNKSETTRSCSTYVPPSGGSTPPPSGPLPPSGDDDVDANENETNYSGDIESTTGEGQDNSTSNFSVEQVCLPLERKCFEKELLECSPDGSEWMLIQECEYGCEGGECKEGQEKTRWINFAWVLMIFAAVVLIITLIVIFKSKFNFSGINFSSKKPTKILLLSLSFLLYVILVTGFVEASDVGLIESATWSMNLTGVFHSSLVFGDIDNDNDNDLIIMGCSAGDVDTCTTADKINIYINNGSSFIGNNNWGDNLANLGYGSLALGDIDNDGDLDIVAMGDMGGGSGVVKIYTNNGSTFIENVTWANNLSNVDAYAGSLALGDIDSDGDLDLFLVGASPSSDNGAYINDGTKFIKKTEWLNSLPYVGYGLGMGAIGLVDLDNDNDLDLVFLGSRSTNFYRGIYINNGTALVEDSSWEDSLDNIFGWPSLTLGDFNSDGKTDLACIGTRTGDHFYIYENNGTGLKINTTEDIPSSACVPGFFDGSIHWGDYDNDGDLDISAIGKEPGRAKIIEQGISNPWNCSFASDDTAHLNVSNQIVQGSLAWNDVNNDGNLDLAITGSDDGIYISKIYISNGTISSSIPNHPSYLNSTFNFSTGKLALSWGNGSDTETPTLGLYYNLRVGTCSGCHDVVSGVYGGSSNPTAGYFGNMMQRKSITLNRPDLENKTIYWAVQTIDTGLAKSSWSDEQVYEIVIASPSCYENWTYGEWSSCVNNQQTRSATDLNNCGTEVNKSETSRSCSTYVPPSGGPSGPSGPSTPPQEPEKPKNATGYFEKILAGVDTRISLNDSGIAIHQVWVRVNNEAKEVAAYIKKLDSKPLSVSQEPEGNVYQYLNITYTNLPDSEIESCKILFRVEISWIKNNSINKSSIGLFRFHNGEWHVIPTTLKKEESDFINYESDSPGFSIFAIAGDLLEEPGLICVTGERKCIVDELLECSEDGLEWISLETCKYGCENGRCVEEPAEFGGGPTYLLPFGIIITLIILIGGIVFHRKRSAPRNSLS